MEQVIRNIFEVFKSSKIINNKRESRELRRDDQNYSLEIIPGESKQNDKAISDNEIIVKNPD